MFHTFLHVNASEIPLNPNLSLPVHQSSTLCYLDFTYLKRYRRVLLKIHSWAGFVAEQRKPSLVTLISRISAGPGPVCFAQKYLSFKSVFLQTFWSTLLYYHDSCFTDGNIWTHRDKQFIEVTKLQHANNQVQTWASWAQIYIVNHGFKELIWKTGTHFERQES